MPNPLSRRQFLSSVVAAGAGVALAGCTSKTTTAGTSSASSAASAAATSATSAASAASSAPAAAAKPTGNLTVWNFSSQLNNAITQKLEPSFPDLKINMVSLGQADANQRLLVSLASGVDLPGACGLSSRVADQYLKTGGIAAFTDAELAPFNDGFDPSTLISYQGKVYGLPLGDGRLGMWVNNSTLEKYKIDADTFTTFDAMADAARKLKQDSGGKSHLFMMPQGTNGADYFSAYVASAGGNWWTDDGKLNEDQSIALNTLNFIVGLIKDGAVELTDWSQPAFYNLIKQEQLTGFSMNFAIGATNLSKNVPDQSGQWRMVNWPKWSDSAPVQTVSYGQTFFATMTKGGNPDAGKAFASWWLTPEGLPSLISAFGTVGYKPARDLPEAQQAFPFFSGQKVIADLTSIPFVNPNFFNWSGVEKVVSYAVDEAVLGKMTPEKAIDYCVNGLKSLT